MNWAGRCTRISVNKTKANASQVLYNRVKPSNLDFAERGYENRIFTTHFHIRSSGKPYFAKFHALGRWNLSKYPRI